MAHPNFFLLGTIWKKIDHSLRLRKIKILIPNLNIKIERACLKNTIY